VTWHSSGTRHCHSLYLIQKLRAKVRELVLICISSECTYNLVRYCIQFCKLLLYVHRLPLESPWKCIIWVLEFGTFWSG